MLALLLAACGAPKSRQTTPHGAIAPATPSISGVVYRIDPRESELRILVYRAGPMAPLGHNHVIVNRALGGSFVYAGAASSATLWLNVPAAGFEVDDAGLRREEGADFAEEVPDDSKAGTLRNMLSPSLLDAARFPAITVRSVAATARDKPEAALAVNVAGYESALVVPFSVDVSPNRLTVKGALNLSQSSLGLTPFSVLLGALRVQDEMRVKFTLVALAN